LRRQYVSTFYTAEKALALADELKQDGEKILRILTAARGNRQEIEHFLRRAAEEDKATALALLEVISAKDLRDTPAFILTNHLRYTPGDRSAENFIPCVMNPRIANELLSPYKSFFRDAVPQELKEEAEKDPHALAVWVSSHIAVNNDLNPQRIPVEPAGVWNARTADAHSRDIFFVALARSLGIPARIEPVAGKVQYASKGRWTDVNFEALAPATSGQGTVKATYSPTRPPDDPKYYSHFTLAKIREDGTLQTLNFESDAQVDMGLGNTWSRLLKQPAPLDAGHYILVTGTRMAKGNVLARLSSFSVRPGRRTVIDLQMRENTDDIQVIGSIDAEAVFQLAESNRTASILQTTGRGYFIIGLLGARQEPTNHALRDLSALRGELEAWNRSILLLFPNRQDWQNFDPEEFGTLPGTVAYGIDTEHLISDMLTSAMHLPGSGTLPVFIIADTFGRVVFLSQGYTIGLGEQLLQTIRKL
jgi:hypothetical protein